MSHGILFRIVSGAGAGALGTVAIQGAMKGQQKVLPQASAPMRRDPADFILDKVQQFVEEETDERLPDRAVEVAKTSLQFAYGVAFGALYGAVRTRPRNVLLEGTLLGVVTWAAGYLGWLPATGLLPKPTKQKPAQIAGPIATHIVFGVATVAAYDRIMKAV